MKREVERGPTFMLTCDLSYTASIIFANLNFTQVKIIVEINPKGCPYNRF